MKYRHIIWDWNGTLVDDAQFAVDLANGLLAETGAPELSLERHREVFQVPIIEYYRQIGIPVTEESFPAMDRHFHSTYHDQRDALTLFEDVAPSLTHLSASGTQNSILSALPGDLLSHHLEHFKVAHFFEHAIGREGERAGSKVSAGRKLIEKLGIRPQEILVVGDTIYDHEVADVLGTDCALIARGHQSEHRLRAVNPTIMARSIAELVGAL